MLLYGRYNFELLGSTRVKTSGFEVALRYSFQIQLLIRETLHRKIENTGKSDLPFTIA
jgi:hypothetical protein